MITHRYSRSRRAIAVLTGVAVLGLTTWQAPTSQAQGEGGSSSHVTPAAAASASAPRVNPDLLELRSAFRLVVVADIARANGGQEITASLAAGLYPQRVVIPGDVAYPDGTAEDFANWFDPSYGVRFEGKMWPVPGNHEYHVPNAQGYRDYFGVTGPTWWVHTAGTWVIIGLDSELMSDPAQMTFLQQTLATYDGRPTVVTYHRARFSTGEHGDDPISQPFWRIVSRDADVRIMLWGHDHDYERMSITVKGRATPLQAFVVGTGGGPLRAFEQPRRAMTMKRLAFHYGVLDLRLGPSGWKWSFLRDDDRTVDAGWSRL